jgi:D-sedoheptulose 7-phosphate isomerase
MLENQTTFEKYSSRLSEVLHSVNSHEVEQMLSNLKDTILNDGIIYVIGNGGSASTASHFVNDLVIIAKRRGVHINAVSLVDNVSIITAIGNDQSFDDVFRMQLVKKLTDRDLVFSISASGNSINLINAVNLANAIGACTISLLGFNGGALRKISKYSCLVPTEFGEYGPVEDLHLSICHYLAASV